jgi:hypothetical protein
VAIAVLAPAEAVRQTDALRLRAAASLALATG